MFVRCLLIMICCLWVMEMFHIRKQLYSDITVYCWYYSSATCMVLVLHWQQVVICKPLPLAWQCVCSIAVTSVLAPCSSESRPRSSALVCMCICWTCPAATSTDVNKTSEFAFSEYTVLNSLPPSECHDWKHKFWTATSVSCGICVIWVASYIR